MRQGILWAQLLGVVATIVQGVDWDAAEDAVVASVRPRRRGRRRCGKCRKPSPRFDAGEGLRRWRTLDLGSTKAYVEAEAPRVTCAVHGVIVAEVPWARHDARFTRSFEDQASWLATHVSKSTLAELMRVAWRSVGRILVRVMTEQAGKQDRLAGLTKLGIDEVSFRKGHRYLTIVVDHDTGRVIWAAEGRNEATLEQFFDLLGPKRSSEVVFVTADAASWIRNVVERRCPKAAICMDTFHVVAWATDALDAVRRAMWNEARKSGQHALAAEMKGVRVALWKNPETLTARQEGKLSSISRTNSPLFRAYLLKEQLRLILKLPVKPAMELLRAWIKWAQRSRLQPFVKLARSISNHLGAIEKTLRYGFTNALIESVNTRIRLLTRIGFGFHSAQPLISLVMLKLGGLCPALPGR